MKERFSLLPAGVCPAGLSREQSAYYCGVSVSTFDELRRQKQAPKPKKVGGKLVFLRIDLDDWMLGLPYDGGQEPGQEWEW